MTYSTASAQTVNPAAIIAIPEANVTALRLFLFSLMAIGRIEKILRNFVDDIRHASDYPIKHHYIGCGLS